MERFSLYEDEMAEATEAEAEAQAEQEKPKEENATPSLPPPPYSHATTATTFDEYLHEDAPQSYVCSITTDLLTNPYVAEDGFVYSEEGLRGWIARCKFEGKEVTSPMTNAKMGEFMIFAQTHKTLVLEFIEKKEAEWKMICKAREAGGKGGKWGKK